MDRFFIRQEISQSTFIENQEDVKHISKVLRLRVNDKIEVVDSNKRVPMRNYCHFKRQC